MGMKKILALSLVVGLVFVAVLVVAFCVPANAATGSETVVSNPSLSRITDDTIIIRFDSNGGSQIGDISGVQGQSITLPSKAPTRDGYNFAGWATTKAGDALYQPGDVFQLYSSCTLYAQWNMHCIVCEGAEKTECGICDGAGRREKQVTCSWCSGGCFKCVGCGQWIDYTAWELVRHCSIDRNEDGTSYYVKKFYHSSCRGGASYTLSTGTWFSQKDEDLIIKYYLPFLQPCDSCAGKGTRKGYVSCEACSGDGYSNCGECKGTGEVNRTTVSAPTAPTVQRITEDTVILNAITNGEYSIDGANWQDSPVFANLEPNATYQFYQRYAKTDTTYASASSKALLVVVVEGAIATGECGDNLTWVLTGDGVLSISGIGAMTDYVYNAPPWFVYRSQIQYVKINEGVTGIGQAAFLFCENLLSVDFPDGMTNIGYAAFQGCESITRIVLPDSVLIIDEDAFKNCDALIDVVMGNGIKSIGKYAFAYCDSLSSIEIPDSVTNIGGLAFTQCAKLTSVTIGTGVTTIGSYAFDSCSNLKAIVLKCSALSIGDNAFRNCNALTDVFYAGTEAQWTALGNNCPKTEYIHYSCIMPNNHWKTVAVEVSCTTDGYTDISCSCGYERKENVYAATGHKDDDNDHVCDNGCGVYQGVHADGSDADHKCDYGCGQDNMTEHSYTSKVVASTCENKGYTIHTCACGDSYTDSEVAATGHKDANRDHICDNGCGMYQGAHSDGNDADHLCDYGCGAIASEHSYQSIVTSPTCTEKGYTTHTCACGHSYVDAEKNALGHNYAAWYEIVAPTCTTEGTQRHDCSRCDHYETQAISAKGHNYQTIVTVPTCTDRGYTTHTCACGDRYVDSYVAATGHKDNNRDHICDNGCGIYQGVHTDGNDADHKCDYGCGEDHMTDHSYSAVVTAPTCENKGFTTYTCVCGDTYTANEVAAKGHTEVIDAAIAATCTKTGMTEGKHCSVCKKILVAQKTTQALGHKPGANATCTTAQSCTVCRTELVAAKGHKDQNSDYVCDTCNAKLCVNHVTEVVPAKEATCEQNGLTAGKKCSLCGEILEQQEIISAKGHNYTDVITAPLCTERGYTTHTCHCGDQYVDNYVAALGHKDDDKDHVCENGCGIYQGTHADGNDADHKCDYGCGTDNMTDHQYDAVVTAPDCTNQGYTTHACVCGHTYTDSYVAALDHEWDDATCEHVETCQNCGATRGQLADHNFGEWIEVQSPTVDEYGTAERMCKTCGKTEQKQLDKLQVQPTVPTEPSNPQDTKPTEPTEPSQTQGTKPIAPTQTGNPQGSKDAGENDGTSIAMVIVLAALCAAAGVATGVVIAKKKQ